jgi:hypothetical protein
VEIGSLGIDLLNRSEDFENGWGNWSVEGSVWQIGVPTSGPKVAGVEPGSEPRRLVVFKRIVEDADLAGVPESLASEVRRRSSTWDRAKIAEKMAKPIALAQKTGLSLYCGEWGCLPAVPKESRLAWYQDMVSVLNEKGIGWATWDYKGGFGLRKRDGKPDQELIDILTGEEDFSMRL